MPPPIHHGMPTRHPFGQNTNGALLRLEEGRVDQVGNGGRVVGVGRVHLMNLFMEFEIEAADVINIGAGLALRRAERCQIWLIHDHLGGDIQPYHCHRPISGKDHIGGVWVVVDVGFGGRVHIAVDHRRATHDDHLSNILDNAWLQHQCQRNIGQRPDRYKRNLAGIRHNRINNKLRRRLGDRVVGWGRFGNVA